MAESAPVAGRWQRVLHAAFHCHRRPERSFFIRDRQLPLCARCTGILIGYGVGLVLLGWHRLGVLLSLALMVPLVLDGSGQLVGYWLSTNFRRLMTGLMCGTAVVHFVVWLVSSGYGWGLDLGATIRVQYL